MDTTFNTKCNPLLTGSRQATGSGMGILGWLRRLADEFPYPEIKKGDYRMAEYIPQDWQSRKS
ncbi:MAG: hypothetical protein ACM3SV_14355 [Betaproteobacteria bacterium]